MPSLVDVQKKFAAAVWDDTTEAMAPLLCDERFSGARLFQIYRNNILISLGGALAAVYPVVQRLVGEGFFGYAADAFIRAHPPDSGNLHDFGAELAAFLAEFPACAEHGYLPDVARLEWAYHEVFHAAPAPAFDLAALSAVTPEQYGALRFGLSPATRLLASAYPLLAIWQANQPQAHDAVVDLNTGGVQLLVFRRALDVEFKILSPGEYALLAAWQAGAPLHDAGTAALDVEANFDLARCLQQHVALGTVTNIPTPSPSGAHP